MENGKKEERSEDPIGGNTFKEASMNDVFSNLEEIEVKGFQVNPTMTATELPFDQQLETESNQVEEQDNDAETEDQQDPWQPSVLPDHYKSPEDAYGAAKYFQGQYDQQATRIQKMERQMEQYGSIKPIADAVIADPSLLSVLANHLTGSSSGGQPQVNHNQSAAGGRQEMTSKASLQEPKAPTRPANMDPYSEEYQGYLEKYNSYLDEKGHYQESLLDQRFQRYDYAMQQQAQADEARKQDLQRNQSRQSAINEAMHVHQLSKTDAERFISDLEKGYFNENIPALLQAWKISNAPKVEDLRKRQTVESAQQRAGANRTPLAATQSGQTPVRRSEEEIVGDALVQEYGVQNNWF